jgi:hypothetical protein
MITKEFITDLIERHRKMIELTFFYFFYEKAVDISLNRDWIRRSFRFY